MINTERLIIRIATNEEMQELIKNEQTEELKIAYGEMLAKSLRHPNQRQWYAVWFIFSKNGERIGDLCFKGVTAEKSTEIGYGILSTFWGKGYATEAVNAVVKWALCQPEINAVEAETDIDNIASKRVLEKVGFKATGQTGEEGPRFIIK